MRPVTICGAGIGALGIVLVSLLHASVGAWAADNAAPLVLERRIPLLKVSGRIDHLAIDTGRQRLFVAELGNGTVDVVDLATGKAGPRIEGLKEPQGVGYDANADMLAVANAGDGTVRFYRGEELISAGVVDLGDDADNIRIDLATGNFIVGYGNGGLAIIEPRAMTVVGRIELPAHPEGFQLDAAGHRAFVNLPDARQIAVVDTTGGRMIASWRVPGARANFPMAFDPDRGMVATVFRGPPRLVLLDSASGTPVASLDICADADDVFFDAKRRRVYVSCGAGAVDVVQGLAGWHRLDSIETEPGARTSLFVPALDRLFVAARAGMFGLGSEAAILVFRPQS